MRQLSLSILGFGALALFQVSLLPHVPLGGFTPNLLLFVPLLFAVFEKPSSSGALVGAFVAGFFWDIFSAHVLGQGASVLVAAVLLVKIGKARYVRIPFLQP